jgi:hypothetical protein
MNYAFIADTPMSDYKAHPSCPRFLFRRGAGGFPGANFWCLLEMAPPARTRLLLHFHARPDSAMWLNSSF